MKQRKWRHSRGNPERGVIPNDTRKAHEPAIWHVQTNGSLIKTFEVTSRTSVKDYLISSS